MQIPIENIYYLLSYAWNKLEEKDRVKVSVDGINDIKDLLAKILINGTIIQLKRGLDKNYIDHKEELSGIKGKIQISDTLKKNLFLKQRAICSFDDFSNNVLLNQILLSTILSLIKTEGLNQDLKSNLIRIRRKFQGIDTIKITRKHFNQIKINRNNKLYGFLMNVCELIYDCILPSEQTGYFKFSDFTRDERKMNQLFEAFIRNFYKIEQNKFHTVKAENLSWLLSPKDESSKNYLPLMKTDITLMNDNEKIIIDAKYYKETMSTYYDVEKIKSNNLYQIFSYLLNQRNGTQRNKTAKGILLYPTVQEEYNHEYTYENHDVEIKTIDLNTSWKNISERLLQLIA